MNNFEVAVFMELETLCTMILEALESIPNILSHKRELTIQAQGNPSHDEVQKIQLLVSKEVRKLFRNLHSFISGCANISKLVWFHPKDDAEALKKAGLSIEKITEIEQKLKLIRAQLHLEKNATFHFNSRGLRNHIEHYNVRLFSLMAETGNMRSLRVCYSKDVNNRAADTTERNYMRTFVVDTNRYIFQQDSYYLNIMEQDVRSLLIAIVENNPLSERRFIAQ